MHLVVHLLDTVAISLSATDPAYQQYRARGHDRMPFRMSQAPHLFVPIKPYSIAYITGIIQIYCYTYCTAPLISLIIPKTFSSSHALPTTCMPTGSPCILSASYAGSVPAYILFSKMNEPELSARNCSAGGRASRERSTRVTGRQPTVESTTL